MEIIERAMDPAIPKKTLHLRVNRFRFVAQAEKNLGTTENLSAANNSEDFLRSHRFRAGFVRRLAKRAVAAKIAAEIRQGNEDFRRERDRLALASIAQRGGRVEQGVEVFACRFDERKRVRPVQNLARKQFVENRRYPSVGISEQ